MSLDSAYAELDLARGASEAEVKAAWRRLVSRWHPDRNASAAAVAHMQRLNHAFELIRRSGFTAGPQVADEGQPDHRPTARPTPPPAAPERTVRRKLRLTLEEAIHGCVKTLRGRFSQVCPTCSGQGRQAVAGGCAACDGSGQVRQATWYGWAAKPIACEACNSTGTRLDPCAPCAGSGRVQVPGYQVGVRIPQGVRSGDLLHVPATPARGGQAPVALELLVALAPHPLFQLDDDGTLRCELPVDAFAWLAEHPLSAPTPDGLHPLALRRGQLVYRLPGLGFPVRRRGPRGDLVLLLAPQFTAQLSAEQHQLLDQLVASAAEGMAKAPAMVDWQQRLAAWQRARPVT